MFYDGWSRGGAHYVQSGIQLSLLLRDGSPKGKIRPVSAQHLCPEEIRHVDLWGLELMS